jgi:hypothetical protein
LLQLFCSHSIHLLHLLLLLLLTQLVDRPFSSLSADCAYTPTCSTDSCLLIVLGYYKEGGEQTHVHTYTIAPRIVVS